MEQTPQKKITTEQLQLIGMVVAAVLFGLSILFGILSGFAYGRSQVEYSNISKINQALTYFSADQGFYPSQSQFFDQRILVPNYLTDFPAQIAQRGSCGRYQNIEYSQDNPQTFKLGFCLEQGAGGLSSGPHILTEKGVIQ